MREFDRKPFQPLLPPRRDEVMRFADRAAHFLTAAFGVARELNDKGPEDQRFTGVEYRGPVAQSYVCMWTLTCCDRGGFPSSTEKRLVLGRFFEKAYEKSPVEAGVLADDAVRRCLREGEALKARIAAGTFKAGDPMAPDTLAFHAAGRAAASAKRLAEELAAGLEPAIIGPEIAALEELLVAARRFGAAP